MHVERFLHKLLDPVIHIGRVKTLITVVNAAISTKKLTLTVLGRAIDGSIQERSGIQKVNRLLGNKHLMADRFEIAKSVSELLIGNKGRPEIIVDWSKMPNSEHAVLRAAFGVEGRALTIYEACYPIKRMGNGKVQKIFLRKLKGILPKACKAIIVTDAGFHNDWFRDVLSYGWDYVGRIRGEKRCTVDGKVLSCKDLFKKATKEAQSLGKITLTKKNPLESFCYLIKKGIKGRKARTKGGKVKQDKDSVNYGRSHREPWLLASSLSGFEAAKKVVGIYKRRMTIEEAFRDLKSSRYGLGLEEHSTRKKDRLKNLLLLGMLVSLIAWLTGFAGEKRGLHYQFQSNSIKTRRVISLFYLGCQMIRKKVHILLSDIWDSIASLKKEAIYE